MTNIPEGWKLVPVEPTPKMLACLVRKLYPEDFDSGKRLQARQRGENRVPFAAEYETAAGQYERMLTASPPAPQPALEVERLNNYDMANALTNGHASPDWTMDDVRAARSIESACAAAWGVTLKEPK